MGNGKPSHVLCEVATDTNASTEAKGLDRIRDVGIEFPLRCEEPMRIERIRVRVPIFFVEYRPVTLSQGTPSDTTLRALTKRSL